MNFDAWLDKIKQHSTGIIGAVIGAIVAILIIKYGLLKVTFIVTLAAIGAFVGTIMKRSKDWLKRIIDKILPPGTYR